MKNENNEQKEKTNNNKKKPPKKHAIRRLGGNFDVKALSLKIW